MLADLHACSDGNSLCRPGILKALSKLCGVTEESVSGRVIVELTLLHPATRQNAAQVLRNTAKGYKVNTDAIALKVNREFAAKAQVQTATKP